MNQGANQDPIEALFEAHGSVRELEIDEEFAEHMAEVKRRYPKHQISPVEVIEVHQNEPEYFDNVGENRRAPVIMVGSTNSGRLVSVPIEPTNKKGIWHPVTAFESNSHHRRRYLERRGE